MEPDESAHEPGKDTPWDLDEDKDADDTEADREYGDDFFAKIKDGSHPATQVLVHRLNEAKPAR